MLTPVFASVLLQQKTKEHRWLPENKVEWGDTTPKCNSLCSLVEMLLLCELEALDLQSLR